MSGVGEEQDEEVTARAAAGAAPGAADPVGPDDHPPDPAPRTRGPWPGAVARAVAVLAVAGAGYALVVPTHPLQRGRLGLLVSPTSGVAAYPGRPARATEQPVSQSALPALISAARGHADRAGIWVASWQGKGHTGSAAVAFLAPSATAATKVLPQLAAVTEAPASYRAERLRRASTWSAPGVPGSMGASYRPAGGPGGATVSVGEVLWRSGRVVELVEVAQASGDPRPDTATAAAHQAAHLAATEPGFTLSPTRYPPLATGLWAGGTALLAVIAGLGPIGLRRRRVRRDRLAAEEAARTIRVGGQVIVRNRRGA